MQPVPNLEARHAGALRLARHKPWLFGPGVVALIAALALTGMAGDASSPPSRARTGANAAAINPLTQLVRTASDWTPIVGRVEQRLLAGRYAYLAVRTPQGALVWTVTLGSGRDVGAQVKVRSMGRSKNFHSRRLHRTFPELVFGIVSSEER